MIQIFTPREEEAAMRWVSDGGTAVLCTGNSEGLLISPTQVVLLDKRALCKALLLGFRGKRGQEVLRKRELR